MLDLVLLFLAVILVIFILVISHLRVVPETEAWVMQRFGVYSRTWHTGLHLKVPFVERCAVKVDLREQILVVGETSTYRQNLNSDKDSKGKEIFNKFVNHKNSYEYENKFYQNDYLTRTHSIVRHTNSQPVITKDNVRMDIDTVVFYQITDPKLYAYGHKFPIQAIEHLAATTLRNVVGELELDETLTSRDVINAKLRVALDEATDAWGIRITRVEIKNIIVSDPELSDAMEKQMIAERKRRAAVIDAEGFRKSEILKAEGIKQATILKAEADKQAKILAAEAQREADICEGEGEAERILLVQQATAEGVKMLNASAPTAEAQNIYLGVKSLEAFQKASENPANTIIVPSELQGLAGLTKSAQEIFKTNSNNTPDIRVDIE
jgi:regulator of protease activity HflC (stomatin/prohibitin superfamily)